MSTVRLTRKLKTILEQRAIEGMIRSLLPLYPEYDRPSTIFVSITVQPRNQAKFLKINQCLEVP
jgi:hypothetical protein